MLAKITKIKKAFRQKNWPVDYHESLNFWYDLLKQASIAQSMYILQRYKSLIYTKLHVCTNQGGTSPQKKKKLVCHHVHVLLFPLLGVKKLQKHFHQKLFLDTC